MSQKLQPVRGTQDLLPEQAYQFRTIDSRAYDLARSFGFEEIDTPIFESSEVFHRTLGETSDMVSKETYTFLDRGGDSITLRPEGTAGIARAFISNGLAQNLPLKLYYSGPMFRYERPQKGRQRQFHQIGIEVLGYEDPTADLECILLAQAILEDLGLKNKINLEINSLGDNESRNKHRDALVGYLAKYKSELSADSQIRLEKNPLRILDSKDASDQKILKEAPQISNYLNDKSKHFFDKILEGLTLMRIPYAHQQHLVRGIDYYTHTVFEFTSTHLGAQSAVLAGGRYDGLISQMGGPQTPGVGWASGLERLSMLCSEELFKQERFCVALIAADTQSELPLLKVGQELRQELLTHTTSGAWVEFLGSGNVGKKFKKANKIQARFALVLGQDEIQKNEIQIKDLKTGEQNAIAMDKAAILAAMNF